MFYVILVQIGAYLGDLYSWWLGKAIDLVGYSFLHSYYCFEYKTALLGKSILNSIEAF